MKRTSKLLIGLIATATLGFAGPLLAQPVTKSQLVECAQTNFTSGHYSSYSCGGDPLTLGGIRIQPRPRIHVKVEGANAFNMYEVYWLSIGGDPATDGIMVGNFLTDDNGDADAKLRDISAPDDASTATPVLFTIRVGSNKGAGHFLLYSRGPYGTDSDGDGALADGEYNTSDGTSAGTVHNPSVDLASDGVQFISGFARP